MAECEWGNSTRQSKSPCTAWYRLCPVYVVDITSDAETPSGPNPCKSYDRKWLLIAQNRFGPSPETQVCG
jgi:hypothetical protein